MALLMWYAKNILYQKGMLKRQNSMNNSPKQLGLYCSIFENFIKYNRIYVDKTQLIYNLITALNNEHFYFVSRPRRFGKSLFISTLKEIFSGRKELFAEYWIGKQSPYDWPKHPIIHLDFSAIARGTAEIFKKDLGRALDSIAQRHNISLVHDDEPERKFITIVEQLHKANKVVLLIDEYDKPIIDHIDNIPIAEENRKILNSFYSTVKSLESHWRAIFITGVSKFSKTSLFSGLNNLRDLSFNPMAAELFGYTYEELIAYFPSYIDDLAQHLGNTKEEMLNNMKTWYDGYRFCDDMQKPQMYSPLSITECLDNKKFANYWFATGNPGFLIALLRLKGMDLELHKTIKVTLDSINAIDMNNLPLFTLLVQTGYLTIVDYDPSTEECILDYPNQEVRESFKKYLMQAFAYIAPDALTMALSRIKNTLADKNFEQFCDEVKTLFAGIPHNLHIKQERYYHSLFHFMFDLLNMRPQSEVASSHGEADLVLETSDSIIVFEFKHNDTPEAALEQIINKKYHEKYKHKNKTVILVGIAVSFKNKTIDLEWVQQII